VLNICNWRHTVISKKGQKMFGTLVGELEDAKHIVLGSNGEIRIKCSKWLN
jgi:hypothetical protein